jgi:hypothetical protein
MNDEDIGESLEVLVVKCEKVLDTMPNHRRDEPCVVSCLPLNLVLNDNVFPTVEDSSLVPKQVKKTEESGYVRFSFRHNHSQSILGSRPSSDDLVFVNDLRKDARNISPRSCLLDGFNGQ